MEVWKIIFLSKSVICRFHVNLPGVYTKTPPENEQPKPLNKMMGLEDNPRDVLIFRRGGESDNSTNVLTCLVFRRFGL